MIGVCFDGRRLRFKMCDEISCEKGLRTSKIWINLERNGKRINSKGKKI